MGARKRDPTVVEVDDRPYDAGRIEILRLPSEEAGPIVIGVAVKQTLPQIILALSTMHVCMIAEATDALDDAGFTPLLVADTAGWVEDQHAFFRAEHPNVSSWSIRDGIVRADGSLGNCGFLRYEKKLCDFVLRLEYRMSAMCNSGVCFRSPIPYTTLEPNTLPSNVGYEFQIMDDAGQPASDKGTGAFYGKLAPRVNAAQPAGDWNSLEIECCGPHIRVTLNGQVVQDIDHTQVPALSGRAECGYVSLQNHGHDIEFRKIHLKELER